MATFLDIGLIQKFEVIFPFLLVLVLMWAILRNSKFLGEDKGFVHAIIAIVLAVLVLLSDTATKVINAMAPWFVVLIMFIFFLLLLSKADGSTESTGNYGWLVKIFSIISFVIFIYSLIDVTMWDEESQTLGDAIEGSPGDSGKAGFYSTLRDPTMMGLMLIFLIGAFSIYKLSSEA